MDDDSFELHENLTEDMRVRCTPRLRDAIRAEGLRLAAGRPRLRGGEAYVARLAMQLGLEVIRASR